VSSLAGLLNERIRATGPITVADYMAEALGHPVHGFYRRKNPLGAAGDFITAPEISQMFGEIVGAWCVAVWRMMGSPKRFSLVELGPGRGTLMADLLRAARLVPEFDKAARPHLVETSPTLRNAQKAALAGMRMRWHDAFSEVPRGPLILVANEFFDALPIRQFIRTDGKWRERLVDAAEDGSFRFVLGPAIEPPALPPAMRGAGNGAIAETCPAGIALAAEIGQRLAAEHGAALLIDYGPARSAPGDSLQAVRRHRYHPVLESPGTADLTAHVDFETLAQAAAPAAAQGPAPQGLWLRRLGIELRAAALARSNPAKAGEVAQACRRLIDDAEMGTLFKVLALTDTGLPTLPGFADAQGSR